MISMIVDMQGSAIEKDLRAALTTLAETLVGETHFINIESSNQQALDFFGLTKEQTPAFVIQSGDSKDKYVLDKITPKQLKGFWKDFKVGSISCNGASDTNHSCQHLRLPSCCVSKHQMW